MRFTCNHLENVVALLCSPKDFIFSHAPNSLGTHIYNKDLLEKLVFVCLIPL